MCWLILTGTANGTLSALRRRAFLKWASPIDEAQSYTEEGQYFDNVEFITEIDEPRLVSWSAPWVDEWPYPARRDQFVISTGLRAVSTIRPMPF